jgi:transcriptional regulator with XRE-family HTH domain
MDINKRAYKKGKKGPTPIADQQIKGPDRRRYWAFKPKAARLKAELSQRQLAKLSGLTPQQISFYERGLSQPRATGIANLCTALNCTPAALFERRMHPKPVEKTGPPECDEPGCESRGTLPQGWPLSKGEAWLCGDHRKSGVIWEKLSDERELRLAGMNRTSPFKRKHRTKVGVND